MTAIQFFVLLAAILSAAGWILSSISQLNATGYATIIALFAISLFIWNRMRIPASHVPHGGTFTKWKRRFARPLPLCFGVIAFLILLSGILHPPNNYDALSYRIPRVLNWLAENRWHWIHTQDGRMNTRICGSEWWITPFLALTKTDRGIFLINVACFLLLPGLVFSTFSRLGVNRRVAWCWMWLAPSGYSFILEAGGDANDILGVLYAIAAMHFALRAGQLRKFGDFCFAILAAALLTNSKSSNLPLLLPVGLAMLPSLRCALRRPVATAGILVIAALISMLPNALINIKKTGDWTGYAVDSIGINSALLAQFRKTNQENVEPQTIALMVKDPLIGIVGNSSTLMLDNFFPPVLPAAQRWNAAVEKKAPQIFGPKLRENFAVGFLKLRELPGEETAGLGFGVSWFLLISCVAGGIISREKIRALPSQNRSSPIWKWTLICSPWIALLVYMIKCSVTSAGRIIAPYYLLLIPLVLIGSGQEILVRKRRWRAGAIAVYLLAFGVLIVVPERPLWPARTILSAIGRHNGNLLVQRAKKVYDVYAQRYDVFAPIRKLLPKDAHDLGFLCISDEPDTSLWRPFGLRRIRQLLFTDDRKQLEKWNVNYVVARDFGPALDIWIDQVGGKKIASQDIQLFAAQPPIRWCIIRLQ